MESETMKRARAESEAVALRKQAARVRESLVGDIRRRRRCSRHEAEIEADEKIAKAMRAAEAKAAEKAAPTGKTKLTAKPKAQIVARAGGKRFEVSEGFKRLVGDFAAEMRGRRG